MVLNCSACMASHQLCEIEHFRATNQKKSCHIAHIMNVASILDFFFKTVIPGPLSYYLRAQRANKAHSKHGTSTHCRLNAGPPSRRWINTKPTPDQHSVSTGPEPLHVQPAFEGDHETHYAQSNRIKYIIELFNNTKYRN